MDSTNHERDDEMETVTFCKDGSDEATDSSLGTKQTKYLRFNHNGQPYFCGSNRHKKSFLRKLNLEYNGSSKHVGMVAQGWVQNETKSSVNEYGSCGIDNESVGTNNDNREATRNSCDVTTHASTDEETEQAYLGVHETHIEIDESSEILKPDLLCGHHRHNDPSVHSKVGSIKLEDLPAALRLESVSRFLLLCSLLTVRISVQRSSRKRLSGKKLQSPFSGTGWLFDKPAEIDVKAGSQNSQGIIYIATSSYLVLNNSEARSCVVAFPSSAPQYFRGRILRGSSVEHICTSGETNTYLKCVTEDVDFVCKLNMVQEEIQKLSSDLPMTIKERLTRMAIVICYPDESKPTLSFSDSTVIRRKLVEEVVEGKRQIWLKNIVSCPSDHAYDTVQVLLYTATTWPGCLGSPVITFRKKDKDNGQLSYSLNIWTHHGVLKTSDYGCTHIKACLEEEVIRDALPLLTPVEPLQASQITQQPVNPSTHQEIDMTPPQGISETPEQTSQQQVMSSTQQNVSQSTLQEPILQEPVELQACQPSVSALPGQEPPSYPVYSTEKKRLESFHLWPGGNIHKPADLAMNGFFYAGYSDCVRCHQCGLGLRSWKEGDDILTEHQRFRPGCPFLQRLLWTRSETRETTQEQSNSRKPSSPSLAVQPHCDITRHLDAAMSGLETLNQEAAVDPSGGAQAGREVSAIVMPVTVTYTHPERFVLEMSPIPEKKNLCVGVNDDVRNPETFNSNLNSEGESDLNHAQDIASRLLQTENRKLQDILTCKVCHQNPIKALFLPCGDLYACESCSNDLSHCPQCKKRILGTVTTFFA